MLHVVTSVQETAGFFKAKKKCAAHCPRLRTAPPYGRRQPALCRSIRKKPPRKSGHFAVWRFPGPVPSARGVFGSESETAQERNRLLRRIPCEAGLHLRPAMRRRVPFFKVPLSGMARILCPGSKTAQTHGRNEPCAACVMRFLIHSASTEPSFADARRSACDSFLGILGKNKLFLQNYLAFCSCL